MSPARVFVLSTLAIAAMAPGALAQDASVKRLECTAPVTLTRLSEPLRRVAQRLSRNEEVRILALGSSSTEGAGASTTDKTYPRRLAAVLRTRLPGAQIQVLNRGVGGEDAADMFIRLDREMLAGNPDLVLWQLGTNALLRRDGIAFEAPVIREGVRRIRSMGADIVLIDPQYAPRVLRDPDAKPMVALMSLIADEMGVPVFQRFALMQHWHEKIGMPFSSFLSPDLFHMNDWSYICFADTLASAIIAAASQPDPAQESEATSARARIDRAIGDWIPDGESEPEDATRSALSGVSGGTMSQLRARTDPSR